MEHFNQLDDSDISINYSALVISSFWENQKRKNKRFRGARKHVMGILLGGMLLFS